MVLYPHAKINIGLYITDKRADGFHNIETVFYPLSLCDTLTVELAKKCVARKLDFTCDGIELPCNVSHDNICCRAYHLLDADFDLPPTRIHLHKSIPAGAGLGGGSSDAAHTLLGLNDLFQLQLSDSRLADYAGRLGSDCCFFFHRTPAFGTSRGEILEPVNISLSRYHILLVKPPVFISTAVAYSCVIPAKPTYYLPALLQTSMSEWRYTVFNDFEDTAFKKFPQISLIKKRLYSEGAVYASMSGSGASVYGIFREDVRNLVKLFPDCFVWFC